MDPFTVCDHCTHKFDLHRLPMILARCGHTFCKSCVDLRLVDQNNAKQCPECGELTPHDAIKQNKKVSKHLGFKEPLEDDIN